MTSAGSPAGHELVEALSRSLGPARGGPLVVGFSGGLDSTVLAETLVRAGLGARTRLVHVDHGLHPRSRDWADHCADYARSRSLAFESVAVRVRRRGNLEDNARLARRQALVERVPPGGVLLLAHHADDQAETLLLRLLRGAGVRGLAAMEESGEWCGCPVLRPLLGWSRESLEFQGRQWGLSWIEDPANLDQDMDRNFLRHRVMPLLRARWPETTQRLHRTTMQLREASELLDERAGEDFRWCEGEQGFLSLETFRGLSPARQRNLLHWWLREKGMRPPGRRLLSRLQPDLLDAGADRQPRLAWREGCLARFAGGLYLLTADELRIDPVECLWYPDREPRIPFGAGILATAGKPEPDACCLRLRMADGGFRVSTARGGERLRIDGMHRRVVELWRRAGVPPWRRHQLPLLHHGQELVAVLGAGVADGWRAAPDEPGREICWWPRRR